MDAVSVKLESIAQENERLRSYISDVTKLSNSALVDGINATLNAVMENVKTISASNETRILEVRTQVEKNLTEIRADNEKQLTAMREVVEEKLTKTVNERISSTFTTINQRLDEVNKGLGELQSLSGGVNDLKKVLTNVKTRGVWGEVSLANILDSILTQEQYVTQYNVTGRRRGDDSGLVDFAIVLPGKKDGERVFLPIDAKFPSEDYQRLLDASEKGDAAGVEAASKALAAAVKKQARSIRDNYINPPQTTDFAVMYLPTEGLYAEVIRNAGLTEELQGQLKVIPAGPTTITALINSLQLGFRTLAVQKSSREVFDLLMKFKKDFLQFAEQITRAQGQIEGVNKILGEASRRNDIIRKKLDKAEGLAPALPESSIE
ncbi:MAG: DNA recombination protein RmuC [Clostridia bacterium]|nr:DNA recombination protein RmuC [Clostridia bacterium]